MSAPLGTGGRLPEPHIAVGSTLPETPAIVWPLRCPPGERAVSAFSQGLVLTVGPETANISHNTEDHEPAALLPVGFLFSSLILPLCSRLNPVLFFWSQTRSDNYRLHIHGPPTSDPGLGSFMITVSYRWNNLVEDGPRASGCDIKK